MLAQQATISRFNKMKLTNANFSILRKLDELGENHDADIVQAKQQISNENRDLKTAHLDIHLDRKNMTMESENKDFHWVNHQMVENRVS